MTSVEYDLYEQHVRKLKDFCNAAHLNFRLECGSYPITLTLTPGEYYHQMSLLDTPEEKNANASMLFALLHGEISVTASGGFSINDTSLKKILSLFAKRFPLTGLSIFSGISLWRKATDCRRKAPLCCG